jgi:hypothetical protein
MRINNLEMVQKKFNDDYYKKLIEKLIDFSNKNYKKINKMKIKLTNLFADETFEIEKNNNNNNYNDIPINLECVCFDLLLNKNSNYNSIIESNSINIGNLFMFYFGNFNQYIKKNL